MGAGEKWEGAGKGRGCLALTEGKIMRQHLEWVFNHWNTLLAILSLSWTFSRCLPGWGGFPAVIKPHSPSVSVSVPYKSL